MQLKRLAYKIKPKKKERKRNGDNCIKCKFSQLHSRPQTVTGAAGLIYDGPFVLKAEVEQVAWRNAAILRFLQTW